MILVWLIRGFRFIIKGLLDGLSIVIPDGLEDDVVAFALTAGDGFAALLDGFVADSVLVVLLGVIGLTVTILFFVFIEKMIRRGMSLFTGNDYRG